MLQQSNLVPMAVRSHLLMSRALFSSTKFVLIRYCWSSSMTTSSPMPKASTGVQMEKGSVQSERVKIHSEGWVWFKLALTLEK